MQDECLRTAVQRFKGRSWKKIGRWKSRKILCSLSLSLSLSRYSFNSDDHAQNGKQSKLLSSRTSFLPCIIVLTTSDSVETCDGIGNLHAAACLDNRTDVQCLHRWQKVLNPNLVKGYWTAEVLLHAFSSLLLPRPDSLTVHTQVRILLD
jgi:hypothetical protein